MNTSDLKNEIPLKNEISQEKNCEFSENFKTTPYVLEREPRIFDSSLIEIIQIINTTTFICCHPETLDYVSGLIAEIRKHIEGIKGSVHPSKPCPQAFNLTQRELNELSEPLKK